MKKRYIEFILLVLISANSCTQTAIPDKDDQIMMAIQAAPENEREGAMVYGYDNKGELVLLREGSNSLICVSDDTDREGFQAVCYHKALQPFMTRGRELRSEGKKPQEVFDIREKEAKEGSLQMPDFGATLHLLEGPDGRFDAETGKVVGAFYRYVVYLPFATAESTGLPLEPIVPGGPWIMDPGTHRAHIMITPPRENQK